MSVTIPILNSFGNILLGLSEDERLIDIARELLCQDLNYDPLALFNYISGKKNYSDNFLTYEDFDNFINNDLRINNQDSQKLFQLYDSKRDNILTYDEFINIFNPISNLQLKRFLYNRIGVNTDIKFLDNTTLLLLNNLFIKEFQLIENIKTRIKLRIGEFDCKKIFNTITENQNEINKENLNNFLLKCNLIYFEEEDLNAILRRLDINRDDKITFEDFNIMFNIGNDYMFNLLNPIRNYSTGLKIRQLNKENEDSNLFKKLIQKYFKEFMSAEDYIEKAKIDLILRADFNINDAFLLFTLNKGKNITNENLINYFKTIFKPISNIVINENDIKLLMKRGDLMHNNFIDEGNFFDLIKNKKKEYRQIIEKKINANNNKFPYFNEGTLIYLNRVLECIIEHERTKNNIRYTLSSYLNDIKSLFIKYSNDKGELTVDDLLKLFKEIEVDSTYEKLFNLVFIHLDRNRTGTIEEFEFMDEFNYII